MWNRIFEAFSSKIQPYVIKSKLLYKYRNQDIFETLPQIIDEICLEIETLKESKNVE